MVVGIGIFVLLAAGVIGSYSVLSRAVKAAREKTELASLVSADLEIMRNLPYVQVGTVNGNPTGNLPDEANPKNITIEGRSYRIYYEVTYVDDPADGSILAGTDSSPNDYKQVKMFVKNMATQLTTTVLTNVSPKGLEGTVNAGALLIKVFNSQGQPISGATVHIVNTVLDPDINLSRTTDSAGNWVEVALPASTNGYHIVVTKNGYSSDQTYPITQSNPNPIKPDATVLVGSVTQVSFSIDLLANLTIRTLDQKCQGLDGVGVNVAGAKTIGTNPTVYKFNQNLTSSGGGLIPLNNIEWDTYTPTLLSGQDLMVYGTSPIQRIDVLPGTTQTFTLIVGPQSTNSLLVIVKDAATGAALEGASVHLQKGGSQPQDYYGYTGGSVWTQGSWTGGSGQVAFDDPERYFADNGNVEINSVPTGLRLLKVTGNYISPGTAESSTFDTGSSNTAFTTITWLPTSQDPTTTLQFQVATNDDQLTWNYSGPDGTAATYYTTSGSAIAAIHNNHRYIRYKVFLSTTDSKDTPILTSLNINYVSGCFTPGQSVFTNLTQGQNYNLDVSLSGYQTYNLSSFGVSNNKVLEVLLSP